MNSGMDSISPVYKYKQLFKRIKDDESKQEDNGNSLSQRLESMTSKEGEGEGDALQEVDE
jgi:hypothetical protein